MYTALHLPVLNYLTILLEQTSPLIGQEDETEIFVKQSKQSHHKQDEILQALETVRILM